MTASAPPEPQAPAVSRHRRWRRVALGLLVGFVAVQVLINGALNLGVAQAIIGRSTDRTRLDFQRAWWVWPVGDLHLKGFTLTQQDSNVWWKVEVDELSAGLWLTGLPRHRVEVSGIDGHGVNFHLEPSSLPTQDGPPDPNSRPWVIHLDDVTLHGVRELDFSRVRFVGGLDLTGSLDLRSRERLRVDVPSLRVTEGFVEVDGQSVARLESLTTKSAVLDAPFQEEEGYDVSRALGGELQAKVEVLPLDWINTLLGASSPVAVHGGGGGVELDLRMKENTVQPGSRLEARGAELDVRTGPLRIRAPWSLQASLKEPPPGQPDGEARLELSPLVVTGPGGHSLEIPQVRLGVLARRREGRPGLDLEPSLHVARSKPLDLRVLNPWLAKTLEIDSGHATVRGEGSALDAKERNVLHLRVDTDLMSGRMGKNRVLLRAEVDVDARDLSPDLQRVGLSGTKLRLRDVSTNSAQPVRGWNGVVALPRATLTLSPTVLWARFESQLTDTQPLVSLLTTSKSLPPFLTSLLTIHDVKLTGQVRIDERGLQLRELDAKGRGFSLEGHLDLVDGQLTGALLTTLGVVTGAVEMRASGDHDIHLLNARAWFQERKTPPFRTTTSQPQ